MWGVYSLLWDCVCVCVTPTFILKVTNIVENSDWNLRGIKYFSIKF